MGRLEGKSAIVTGAASGIGAACVARFLAEGAQVMATDLTVPEEAAGGSAVWMAQDVSDEDGWAATIRAATERFGKLDIVVNNAGVAAGTPTPIAQTELADWRSVMSVNLDGVFLGVKHAMRAMAGHGGAIVNMGSVHSFVAIPDAPAYCASKGGLLMLTRVAALEGARLDPPVRVNSVHPGYVDTPLVMRRLEQDPKRRAAIEAATPLGRLARPEEIATAVLNLVTDDSAYITGSAVTIDGGYTVR